LENILNNENISTNIMLVSFIYDFASEEVKINKHLENIKHF
jgi:hypothetical protein